MGVLRDVFLHPVVEQHICSYNKDSPVYRCVLHIHRFAVEYRLLGGVVAVAFVVEPDVSELGCLFLEDYIVDRHKLKVHNLHLVVVVSIAVAGSLRVVVSTLGGIPKRVVTVLVHYRGGNLLILLLGELVSRKPFELHNGNGAEVPSVCEVRQRGVVGVVVDKVRRVYILLFNSVVGVIGSFDDGDTAGHQVLNAAAVDSVVKIIPRKGHLRCQLCGNLGVCLYVGI